MANNRGAHNRSAETIVNQIKLARKNGEVLEEAVKRTAAEWKAQGLATVRKAYARSRTDGGHGVGGDAPVDFSGALASGQKVAFDCKSITRMAAYSHDPNRQHQLVFLKRIRKQGGLAFLLLYDSDLGMAFLCRDIDTLARGEPVPVRNVGIGRHVVTARLPTTTCGFSGGVLWTLPDLLADAQHHCAPDETGKG